MADEEIFWTRADGGRTTVGFKAAFVRANPIAFVELLGVGKTLQRGEAMGLVQQKRGREFEIDAPIAGKIVAVNDAVNVVDDPSLLAEDPEGRGWLVVIQRA